MIHRYAVQCMNADGIVLQGEFRSRRYDSMIDCMLHRLSLCSVVCKQNTVNELQCVSNTLDYCMINTDTFLSRIMIFLVKPEDLIRIIL